MRIPLYHVDAFAARRFAGNPAAVMPLPRFLPDADLLAIAAENNLSETAFLVAEGDDYRLRWFTPVVEVPLGGHGTLASAAVVMEKLKAGVDSVVFHTASGALTVTRAGKGYAMNFPARPSTLMPAPPAALAAALGVTPSLVHVNSFYYMAVLKTAAQVRALKPDIAAIARLDRSGIIVTATAERPYDFVSRYFAPTKGIPEDPVTGSAHCTLAPYWAEELHKPELRGFQASTRGGEVVCRILGDRIELQGSCVFYLEGAVEF